MPVQVEQRHVDPSEQIGRNDPCWCGSGKKFKGATAPRRAGVARLTRPWVGTRPRAATAREAPPYRRARPLAVPPTGAHAPARVRRRGALSRPIASVRHRRVSRAEWQMTRAIRERISIHPGGRRRTAITRA